MSKWSHTIQTHEVQGSAVNTLTLTFPDLFLKAWLDWAVGKCSRDWLGRKTADRLSVGPQGFVPTSRNPRGEG